ncbi:hypothetical protein GON26_00340 [Flavobacterium sp. GA093]|uniref:Lipocalin-like domain-containing protein n=1 Tax=Flavobacterium hydrocarbonoxydans TaxID=2683249 RepID=A0A6I4NFX2_9FLAO|nr:hypothetical protein [Flavobacterium hydrocarbonoxydans]MWB92803.1 hypothetical protein [Flavobacterium hydrocarbonoxydans]
MKKTISLLILIVFSFYNLNAQTQTENISERLIGKWIIAKSISRGESGKSKEMEVVCNVCPTIIFSTDQNCLVIKPDNKKELYIWKIANDQISFINVGAEKNKNPIFDSADFKLKFSQLKEYVELELIDIQKHGSIILAKEN